MAGYIVINWELEDWIFFPTKSSLKEFLSEKALRKFKYYEGANTQENLGMTIIKVEGMEITELEGKLILESSWEFK